MPLWVNYSGKCLHRLSRFLFSLPMWHYYISEVSACQPLHLYWNCYAVVVSCPVHMPPGLSCYGESVCSMPSSSLELLTQALPTPISITSRELGPYGENSTGGNRNSNWHLFRLPRCWPQRPRRLHPAAPCAPLWSGRCCSCGCGRAAWSG